MAEMSESRKEARDKTGRWVHKALRNYLHNEVGISKDDIRAMVVGAAEGAATKRADFIEAAIARAIGNRVSHWRGGGAAEFRRMIDAAIQTEVQRVVGEIVRAAMKNLKVELSDEG